VLFLGSGPSTGSGTDQSTGSGTDQITSSDRSIDSLYLQIRDAGTVKISLEVRSLSLSKGAPRRNDAFSNPLLNQIHIPNNLFILLRLQHLEIQDPSIGS
jgi:hypothetical protein